jgi:hypothetical protein
MDCSLVTTADGCLFDSATDAQVGVVIHYVYGKNAAGTLILHKTLYTNAAGDPLPALTGTQTVTAGVCQPRSTDVEWVAMVDDTDNDTSTPGVPFLRKYTVVSSGITGAVISETVEDFEPDMETTYTVVGTATLPSASDYETSDLTLCDSTGTSFIRRVSYVNGTKVTVGDFELDGDTAYTPVGAVGACPQCAPVTAQGVVTSWA